MSDGPHEQPEVKGLVNKPLEKFLILLAVDASLRDRYSAASRAERAALLANEFGIGDDTIDALLEEPALDGYAAVAATLDHSDQQAQKTRPPRP